jgi:diguanylate cyclase (GGDEF)-like protein
VWLRRSLARDTAALVLGLSLVAAVLMGLAAREILVSSLRASLEDELNREYEGTQAGLAAWRNSARRSAEVLASDPELLASLARGKAGASAARVRLHSLIAREPEALGIAIVRGRDADGLIAVSDWLSSDWPTRVDWRAAPGGQRGSTRLDGTLVEIVRAQVKGVSEPATLIVAVDPLLAFDVREDGPRARTAILDEKGELLVGSRASLELAPPGSGFSVVANAEGHPHLVLRRAIASSPWQFVAAEQIDAAPTTTLAIVVLASLLIASLAGLVAFTVAVRRLQPLLELAEGARRLAAGEAGVQVAIETPHGEVAMLARSFNEMAGRLASGRETLEERNQELLRANEVLEQLSITDGLTHLHNHRHFHDQFAREVKRAERSGQPLCLMLIDIDDFKQLNDRLGHATGDRVLAVVAQLMNAQVRESDYLARYGGEEFAMLLPQTRLEGAIALAEKIRSALAQHLFELAHGGEGVHVTVSIGVAEHATTQGETFDAADRALYDAKGAGKDCVVAAPTLDRPAPPGTERRRR